LEKYLNLQSQIGGVDPIYNPKGLFIVKTTKITSPLYQNYGNNSIYIGYNDDCTSTDTNIDYIIHLFTTQTNLKDLLIVLPVRLFPQILKMLQQLDKKLLNNITSIALRAIIKDKLTIDTLIHFCNSSIFVNLQILDLVFCSIDDAKITELSNILHSNEHLTMINLAFNNITNVGASAIISSKNLRKTGLTIDLMRQESGPITITSEMLKQLSPTTILI
jgi:hypothetical protein